jgi:hypothetical protein
MRLVLAKKVAVIASLATIAHSFTAPPIRHQLVQPPPTRTTRTTRTLLFAARKPMSSPQQQHHDDHGEQPKADLSKILYQMAVGFALTTTLWTAVPAVDFSSSSSSADHTSRPTPLMVLASRTANAKEMASGSGSRVNKDPESLLRYGLPISNKEVSARALRRCTTSGRFCRFPFRVASCRAVVGCWNESSNY